MRPLRLVLQAFGPYLEKTQLTSPSLRRAACF